MLRNPCFSDLQPNYLFSAIQTKIQQFKQQNPQKQVINLSIGNTTQPLDPSVVQAFTQSIESLGSSKKCQGYGSEFGLPLLREKLAETIYNHMISDQEIFISDGAKVDIFRLLSLFGPGKTIAVQDPSYPAYADAAYLTGAKKIVKLPCVKEHDFFPQIPQDEHIDIFCLCSPNNPTGTTMTHDQLLALVDYARTHRSIILFDAAYSAFISDPSLPRSIYEVPGSRFCAIEINSFSKPLSFAGIRLGWTVLPKELCYADNTPIMQDWKRFLCTTFNGASLPAQYAAIQGLSLFPRPASIQYYQTNSTLLKQHLQKHDFVVFGGEHAPYLWVEIPQVEDDLIFDFFLQNFQIAVTPGSGFGHYGKGFARFSSLGKREDIVTACERLDSIQVEYKLSSLKI